MKCLPHKRELPSHLRQLVSFPQKVFYEQKKIKNESSLAESDGGSLESLRWVSPRSCYTLNSLFTATTHWNSAACSTGIHNVFYIIIQTSITTGLEGFLARHACICVRSFPPPPTALYVNLSPLIHWNWPVAKSSLSRFSSASRAAESNKKYILQVHILLRPSLLGRWCLPNSQTGHTPSGKKDINSKPCSCVTCCLKWAIYCWRINNCASHSTYDVCARSPSSGTSHTHTHKWVNKTNRWREELIYHLSHLLKRATNQSRGWLMA